MTMGLKVPVGVSTSGGAYIEKSDGEQMKKILFLALSQGDDKNPFQNLGREINELIFRIKKPSTQARAKDILERVLAKFSDRIQLAPDAVITFQDIGEGEWEMSFEYVDLALDKVQEFKKKFTR